VDEGPAGNLSATAARYDFNVGAGTITGAATGDRTAKQLNLAASGRGEFTDVRFQYRRGSDAAWEDIPAGHVLKGSTALSTWPLSTDRTTTSGSALIGDPKATMPRLRT
jgi:hypothetical protein